MKRRRGPSSKLIAILSACGLLLLVGLLVALDRSGLLATPPAKPEKPKQRPVASPAKQSPRVARLVELKEVRNEIEVVKERLAALRSLGAFREQLQDTGTPLEIPSRRVTKETREAMQLKDRLSALSAREAELEVATAD